MQRSFCITSGAWGIHGAGPPTTSAATHQDAVLLGAQLQGVVLRGACLDAAKLDGACLEGVLAAGASMERAQLSKAPGRVKRLGCGAVFALRSRRSGLGVAKILLGIVLALCSCCPGIALLLCRRCARNMPLLF